jgi:hypothetical protein
MPGEWFTRNAPIQILRRGDSWEEDLHATVCSVQVPYQNVVCVIPDRKRKIPKKYTLLLLMCEQNNAYGLLQKQPVWKILSVANARGVSSFYFSFKE